MLSAREGGCFFKNTAFRDPDFRVECDGFCISDVILRDYHCVFDPFAC